MRIKVVSIKISDDYNAERVTFEFRFLEKDISITSMWLSLTYKRDEAPDWKIGDVLVFAIAQQGVVAEN